MEASNRPSFSTLLYRYFFFGWLFRDVAPCRDNLFQRAAVERHNLRQAAWLPTYALRWLVLALLVYAAGGGLELACDAPVAAASCYGAGILCLSVALAIGIAWLGITRSREPS